MKRSRNKKTEAPPTAGPSRQEALGAVPRLSREITWHHTGSGVIQVRYPVIFKPWFARLAERAGIWDGTPQIRTLELDEIGSVVFRHIDGNRSVRDIIDMLAEKYSLHPREAEVSVVQFIRQLGQRGIVGL